MKVNVYDPENINKGKLMLSNIAEDLKTYAKVKVAPFYKSKEEEDEYVKPEEKKKVEKKQVKVEELK